MQADVMRVSRKIICTPSRRRFLQRAGILGGMAATFPAWSDTYIDLDLPGGPNRRELTTAFPQKGPMILQRTRPPLLETPFEVFNRGVFTPNDQFYVRWGERGRHQQQLRGLSFGRDGAEPTPISEGGLGGRGPQNDQLLQGADR